MLSITKRTVPIDWDSPFSLQTRGLKYPFPYRLRFDLRQ